MCAIFKCSVPFRDSETQHENVKEDLLNDKPAAESFVEPVSDQMKQEETIDMVGCHENTVITWLSSFSFPK